jgi:hypothetical protein
MEPTEKVRVIFPENPPDDQLHIVVQVPSPGKWALVV